MAKEIKKPVDLSTKGLSTAEDVNNKETCYLIRPRTRQFKNLVLKQSGIYSFDKFY